MVVIEMGPHVAVRVQHEITSVIFNLHRGVLSEPRAYGEKEEHPTRIAIKLREPTRNKSTQEHAACLE